MAGVGDLGEARSAFPALAELAYVPAPHRPSIAHHFAKPAADPTGITYGLHLTEPGSDLWRERLAFRDALRADASLAAEYAALKLRLAAEHGDDAGSYTRAKRPFVARVLAGAGITLGDPAGAEAVARGR